MTAPEYILAEYRKWLRQQLSNAHSADTYYYAVLNFFRTENYESIDAVDESDVIVALSRCHGRNQCTQLRLGLLRLQEFAPGLSLPDKQTMAQIQRKKRDRRKPVTPKTLYLDETVKKLNYLRSKKLKYAYFLMLCSGLRVSEVAALDTSDIKVTPEGRLQITVRHGKGDKYGVVTCLENSYLEQQLPAYLHDLPPDEKPFYSGPYMKQCAGENGIECHDLRRMAAQVYRNEQLAQRYDDPLHSVGIGTIDGRTMAFLRHSKFKTTRKYLRNRPMVIHKEDAVSEKEQ